MQQLISFKGLNTAFLVCCMPTLIPEVLRAKYLFYLFDLQLFKDVNIKKQIKKQYTTLPFW